MFIIERRTLLVSAISAAFSLWLSRPSVAALGARRARGTVKTDTERCLIGLFSDQDAPRAVGRRYLEMYFHEGDRAWLLKALIGAARPQSPEALRTELASRRRHDFWEGNIVIVDGWVLSRTEARACALTALIGNSSL